MWLPTSVYERVPQFWFLMGLLFVLGGLYLGPNSPLSIMYLVIGILSCALGVAVTVHRMKYRKSRSAQQESDTAPE
jgi:disulfide bond formation protein DsbB